VVAALVAGDDVLLLEAAADADVEVLVPPAVLGNAVSATVAGPVLANAVSATVEGSCVLVLTARAVLDVDGVELLDPAMAEVLLGSCVDCAMDPVVLDDVDSSTLVLTDVADDDMLLLNACVDGLGVAVLVRLEEVDDVNASVLAALVAEDDVLLLEAAVDADVEVLVPPVVLANAVSATVEASGVLAFTALTVLDVDGDELLDPATAKVLVGSGVDVAMNHVVLDDVDASTLVLTAIADDVMPLLNACVDGLGVAVLEILEEVDDVNASVLAALVAEDDVALLEGAADADVEVLVPPAVLVDAISATVEGSGVLVFTALAVLAVEGDELLDSAGAEVLVGTGVDVVMIPVVLDDVDANTPGLTAVADDGVLLLEAGDTEVEVPASPAVLEDVAFALGNHSDEPSSPVKLGAGLASLAPIRV